jgi:hypothetical protein
MREHQVIKTVAKNGHISLGKKFAGKQIQILEPEDETLIIKRRVAIPENELGLYKGDNIERISKSLEWFSANPRKDNFPKP